MTAANGARAAVVWIPLLAAGFWAGHRGIRVLTAQAASFTQDVQLPPLVDARGEPRALTEFLADYWGERWPQVRRQLLERGIDLDRPVQAGGLAAWEAARLAVRDSLAGDGFPSDDFAAYFQGFGGKGAESEDPELEVAIRFVAEEAAEHLRLALDDIWARDAYERAPFVGPVRSDQSIEGVEGHGVFTYTDSFQVDGWAIEVRFDSAAYPELDRCLRDIQNLRRESRRKPGARDSNQPETKESKE